MFVIHPSEENRTACKEDGIAWSGKKGPTRIEEEQIGCCPSACRYVCVIASVRDS